MLSSGNKESNSPNLRWSNRIRPTIYHMLKQNKTSATIAIDLSTLVTYNAFSHVASENDNAITKINTQFVKTSIIINWTGHKIGSPDLFFDIILQPLILLLPYVFPALRHHQCKMMLQIQSHGIRLLEFFQ